MILSLFAGKQLNITSLAEEAYKVIREAILEGRIKPEDKLVEEKIANELGVSRTPIREALRALETEGVIQFVRGGGAIVCRFSKQDIVEIYDLRMLLEGYAAKLASQAHSKDNITLLESLCKEMDTAIENFVENQLEQVRELVRLNNQFHQTILNMSGNQRLKRIMKNVLEIPLVYKAFFRYSPEQRRISNHFHWEILKALKERDPERAERLMKEHIYTAKDFFANLDERYESILDEEAGLE